MNYDDAINYLESLNIFGIKPGLERITLLAEKLKNPQNFYKTIHVTGTNGKGSTCAMISQILHESGKKVGLFTSPHLESYCERIKIDGKNISEEDFAKIIERISFLQIPATQFEILTAAAFFYFAEKKVDFAVIEVGMGGTWDSTNIITPEISVITNVSLEHENILGNLENISLNKAGIIKKNIPVVTGADGEPLKIIREVAEKNFAPIYEVHEPANVKINLRGEFQKFNAAIAIEVAKILKISEEKIFCGLEKVSWAGRFEILETKFGKILIDGAHNPHGAKALRESLDKNFPEGRRNFIFGALADKNIDEMIEILFRAEDFVIVALPNSSRAESVEKICKKLQSRGVENFSVKKISDAVEKIQTLDGLKVAAGSLYLIGDVRKILVRT